MYAFWYLPMYVTYAIILAHVRDHVPRFYGNDRTLTCFKVVQFSQAFASRYAVIVLTLLWAVLTLFVTLCIIVCLCNYDLFRFNFLLFHFVFLFYFILVRFLLYSIIFFLLGFVIEISLHFVCRSVLYSICYFEVIVF